MKYAIALMLTITIGTGLHSQEAAKPKAPTKYDLESIDKYLSEVTQKRGHVGFSVAVVEKGKLVLSKGYGVSNLKTKTPVDDKTIFCIGSVTKQFACACIFLLEEDGKLSVDDPVSKWYPNATKAKEITLYDLMTHVSGYPDYYPLDFVDSRMEKTTSADDIIKTYAGGKLDFEPRTNWSYSNTGYTILGRVIEKVSGKTFGEFLKDRIFTPLEMKNSQLNFKDAKEFALGYRAFGLNDPEPAPLEKQDWGYAAGGIFSTPSDLAKWNIGLHSGKVLKPGSYYRFIAPVKFGENRVRPYGCGIGSPTIDGEVVMQHGGAMSGYHCYSSFIPRTQFGLMICTNAEHVDEGAIAKELLSLIIQSQRPKGPPKANVPQIQGLTAKEQATEFMKQLQSGKVNRKSLSEEFNRFLSDEFIAKSKDRLKELGEPKSVTTAIAGERGGMEVSITKFVFEKVELTASMYRKPDGTVEQFLLTAH